ncbi:MAG: LCP family protein [Clostridia bacterium]|nr:LCP family protein [Clostridia bacterium]
MSRKERNEEKKHKKKHKVLKVILAILLIILVSIGGFVSYSTYVNGWGWQGLLATMMGHNQETVKELEELKVLLLGVSTDIDSKLTDTIMVASYNPKTQSAVLLSVPRDTFVGKSKTSANSYDKINALYQKGPEKTLEAVNEITGLDIKYYAVIDNQALIKTVDEIGGVEFDVPIKMKYDDPSQDLHINLQPGLQKIDGEKAEQLLRFRHNNNGTSYSSEYGDNDIGRMRTQREFISETIKQTLQLKNVMKLGNLAEIVYENVETNVKLSDVKDYLPYAVEFNIENLKTGAVPGAPTMINKLSFFEYNKSETKKLIEELFDADGDDSASTSNTSSSSTSESSTTTKIPTSEAAKVKIELLNGSGNSKLLTEATNLLKKKGYNVYKTGTTASSSKTSIVVNSDVKEDVLNNIKELLDTGTVTNSATSSQSKTDLTIILGKDYK